MYIILSTRTEKRSYSHLHLGEIDNTSDNLYIIMNLEIAFFPFIFRRLPEPLLFLCDLFRDINFYDKRLAKF